MISCSNSSFIHLFMYSPVNSLRLVIDKEQHNEYAHNAAEHNDHHHALYLELNVLLVTEVKHKPEYERSCLRVDGEVVVEDALPDEETLYMVIETLYLANRRVSTACDTFPHGSFSTLYSFPPQVPRSNIQSALQQVRTTIVLPCHQWCCRTVRLLLRTWWPARILFWTLPS